MGFGEICFELLELLFLVVVELDLTVIVETGAFAVEGRLLLFV
jgi:hypothetical protein